MPHDGVGMDAAVDLRKGSLKAPIELQAVVFVILEPLKIFDEVELELWAEPRAELKGDVFVRVGATVASCAGVSPLAPVRSIHFWRQKEAVAPGFISNSLEFEGIKTGIVDVLPDTQEEHGILVLEPLLDEGSRTVKVPHHVGEGDVIALRLCKDSDRGALDFDGASFGFAHGV